MKKYIICASIFLAGLIAGCESIDDNYKQYLEEYNYSGKISNLKVAVGFQRAILTWDNPTDQKSKTSLIVFGKDSIAFDQLVDSVSISGLNSGSGYDFSVFTLDAYGNRSVPISISALPVSQDFVDRLTIPGCRITKSGTKIGIAWSNLSNVSMQFAGKIEYQVSGSNNLSIASEALVTTATKTKAVSQHTIWIPELKTGQTYTVSYSVSVWPVLSKNITEDIVVIKGTATIRS